MQPIISAGALIVNDWKHLAQRPLYRTSGCEGRENGRGMSQKWVIAGTVLLNFQYSAPA